MEKTTLSKAYQLQLAAANIGFDWPAIDNIFEKLDEEIAELKTAIKNKDVDNIVEELGDLLFTSVNCCRHLGIEPDNALHIANNKFKQRLRCVEKIARKKQINMALSSLEELQALWEEAKQYGEKS